ncbi:MAG TPA: ATP-binding protein [Pirellulales bacterium]|nr:ATP-binding protein [Pirellulales bacterium]
MTNPPPPPPKDAPGGRPDTQRRDLAEQLARSLAVRYAIVFLAVASLLAADQAVIQPSLLRLNGYAPVINMAGRQRMLSQKLAKQAQALQFGVGETWPQSGRNQLEQTIEQWSEAHALLREGDEQRGIRPITTPQIASALADLDRDFAPMRAAARRLAESGITSPDRQPAEIELSNEAAATSRDTRMALVHTILEHEPNYLAGMEWVVAMLESEAQQQVARLRLGALVAVVLALILLASLYAFVVRPATRLIRRQLHLLSASDERHRALVELLRRARDELELRVAERTSQLTEANAALRLEMGHRRHAETRLRRLSADLAHASRVTALGQLATGLAHELNQPLGAIANYAGTCELLLEKEPTKNHPLRRAISEVKRSALRAGSIVRRMRNFLKQGVDQASRVDVDDLVREVAELCEPELRRREVELTLDLRGKPTAVFADPIQIQQVLVNLVQNAMQALREIDGLRLIEIRTLRAADGVQVEVADSGPGFSREVLCKEREPDASAGEGDPFAPFYTTKADGLGMGLAISRSIIEQHQGRIWADNRPAGGAVVRFYLPFDRAHDTAERTAAHSLCG